MRGVIASIAPHAWIEDATHDVPPGDVFFAAWTLSRYWQLFPANTVHVVVVDPGVGTSRRGLVVEARDRFLIAPDNGVLTLALAGLADSRAFEIANPEYQRQPVSSTFHGRDVFAPVAAHLARGVRIDAFGPPASNLVRLDVPTAQRTGNVIVGEVLLNDRFGNLITNVPGAWLSHDLVAAIAGREVPLRRTYGDAATGELLAVIGSAETLEISIRDGNAALVLGVGRRAEVQVHPAR